MSSFHSLTAPHCQRRRIKCAENRLRVHKNNTHGRKMPNVNKFITLSPPPPPPSSIHDANAKSASYGLQIVEECKTVIKRYMGMKFMRNSTTYRKMRREKFTSLSLSFSERGLSVIGALKSGSRAIRKRMMIGKLTIKSSPVTL
jgi:hypothetical protein